MDIKAALLGQYQAGLGMLRQAVDLCPDDMWTSGEHPRNFWRIAYHAAFFTHLYAQKHLDDFEPWSHHVEDADALWHDPPEIEPYTREQILAYIDEIFAKLPGWVERLDLDSEETGFHWYPSMNKLEHQILNVRHLQGHVGQLSELLMTRDIDVMWTSSGPKPRMKAYD